MRLVLTLALLAVMAYAPTPAPGQAEKARAPKPLPLTVSTTELPRAVAQFPYNAPLQAEGGTPPYRWSLDRGALPAGLAVDPAGHLIGTPASVGEFGFQLRAMDSATKPQTQVQGLLLHVVPPLVVESTKPAAIQGNGISGSVGVINYSPDSLDLTLIIVAVNEIGKAFALGYQKVTLPASANLDDIPFGTTLPVGQYIVHVDAVGEDPAIGRIFRSRFQTAQPLAVVAGP